MRERFHARSEAAGYRSARCADHAGAIVAGLVAMALGLSTLIVPTPLVLPFLATAMLTAAAIVAGYAWHRSPECADRERAGLWDLSGGCALIGISAAELGEPEHLLALVSIAPP